MSETKKRLEYLLKHNTIVQSMYKYGMSFIFRFIGLFIKTKKKLILFNSFGGRKFNDSPRVIFEAMQKDLRFKDYLFVWAFEEPDKFSIPGAIIMNYPAASSGVSKGTTMSEVEVKLLFKNFSI